MRNGSFYLLCRIGDLRQTHLLESHVSGLMVKKEVTPIFFWFTKKQRQHIWKGNCFVQVTEEGETIPYHLEGMDFGTEIDGTEDFFQMFWPIIVSHKIDEESPLWEISARDLTSKMQFEIVLTMEGITPETGNTIQVKAEIGKHESMLCDS